MTRNALNLIRWSDHYTLGMFLAKVNLTQYGLRSIKFPTPREKNCFLAGCQEGPATTFRELALEISQLRKASGPDKFDSIIRESAGQRIYSEIMDAIRDAKDWETQTQTRVGMDLISLRNRNR